MEKKTIGLFLAALRKANGLTQKQLAERLHVSDKAVSRWERDECAPDLALIPVLAEIFNVTSDEILRGQRKTTQEPETKYETQRTERQIQRILKETITNFKIHSTISVSIAIIGFIAAMICNMFSRANLGFGIACIFYVAEIMCQVIFTLLGLNALNSDELSSEQTEAAKATIIKTTTLVLSLAVVLFCASLPLISLIRDAFQGLSTNSWIAHGAVNVLIGAAISLTARWIVNIRLGYQTPPDMKAPKNRLRVRSIGILALVLILTFIPHEIIRNILQNNPQLLTEGTRWDTWEELKEYLETPMTPDGEEMTYISSYFNGNVTEYDYMGPDGGHYTIYDYTSVLVYEPDMETPKYEYVRFNQSVNRFSYSFTEDHLPIYTFDRQQMITAETKLLYINIALCTLYIVEIATAILIYINKSKKLRNTA